MQHHPYTVQGEKSPYIWLGLALVSLILASALLEGMEVLSTLLIPATNHSADSEPWMQSLVDYWNRLGYWQPVVRGSPLFAIFLLLYTIFDRWLWRWNIFRKLVNTRYLKGNWDGELESTHSPNVSPLEITLLIDQTWRGISIVVKSKGTYSYSLTAGLAYTGPNRICLMNNYHVDGIPGEEPKNFVAHDGTNKLFFTFNHGSIDGVSGKFYTEGDHGSHGTMSFRLTPTNGT